MELEKAGQAPVSSPRLFDRQGWSILAAGALLLLISFTTNYGDDSLLQFGSLQAAHQVGVGLHFAALAAIVGVDEVFSEGVVELATRLRHRDARAREQEAYEAARDREQAARRARIQARCFAAQSRFLLADTARNRLQLSEALAVLLEELRLLRG